MSTTQKYLLGTQATLLSTELNALANNSLAIGSAFNNVQGGGGGDGYVLCDVQLSVTFGSAPTANTGCSVWFLQSQDGGTTFEDGSATITPARLPDVVFPVRAVTTAQVISRRVMCPWGTWKPLLKDDGTGVAFPATGSTLTIRPVTMQGV